MPPGSLKIDGRTVNCGKRPTVLNSYFDSWGGAFPGFLILNTKKINGLSTAVKLYVNSPTFNWPTPRVATPTREDTSGPPAFAYPGK